MGATGIWTCMVPTIGGGRSELQAELSRCAGRNRDLRPQQRTMVRTVQAGIACHTMRPTTNIFVVLQRAIVTQRSTCAEARAFRRRKSAADTRCRVPPEPSPPHRRAPARSTRGARVRRRSKRDGILIAKIRAAIERPIDIAPVHINERLEVRWLDRRAQLPRQLRVVGVNDSDRRVRDFGLDHFSHRIDGRREGEHD